MPDSNDSRPARASADSANGVRVPIPKTITIELPADVPHLQKRDPRGGAGGSILLDYLWRIGRHKWKIILFVLASTVAAGYLSSRRIPIYQSTAMIEVDRGAPVAIVGQESQGAVTTDTEQFLTTQMKLIQSDSVLRPVVLQYDPERVTGNTPMPLADHVGPVELFNLAVTRPLNTYLIQITYRHPNKQLAATVANAVAESYIDQIYGNRYQAAAGLSSFMEKQLGDLRARMERSGAALTRFERDFQMIDPEQRTSIVSARLLQLNTEYTQAQSDRVRKEVAFNSVRAGSADAAFVSSQGEGLKKLQDRLNEAQEKFAQLKTQVGVNHPDYIQAASQVAELTNQIDALRKSAIARAGAEFQTSLERETMIQNVLAETKHEFDEVNAHSYKYRALKEDAENDKKLYDELMHKIQESSINSGFEGSWIRLVDRALPASTPVHHSVPTNVAVAFLLSGGMAIGAVLLFGTLDGRIQDPIQVTQMGSRVLGSLPLVPSWKRSANVGLIEAPPNVYDSTMVPAARHGRNRPDANCLAFEEALRWIRESILLSAPSRPIRTLLVTSASPKEGKSTFAARLAITNARHNTKTLLIDADLRNPSAHIGLGLNNTAGLSDVIRSQRDWRELVQTSPRVPNLEFLPAGPPSHRVFDLLGPTLEHILDEAYEQYGLIVIDSPPALEFAEPLKAASLADGVVVLAQASSTPRKALQAVLSALGGVNAEVVGVVLNRVNEQDAKKYYYPSAVTKG